MWQWLICWCILDLEKKNYDKILVKSYWNLNSQGLILKWYIWIKDDYLGDFAYSRTKLQTKSDQYSLVWLESVPSSQVFPFVEQYSLCYLFWYSSKAALLLWFPHPAAYRENKKGEQIKNLIRWKYSFTSMESWINVKYKYKGITNISLSMLHKGQKPNFPTPPNYGSTGVKFAIGIVTTYHLAYIFHSFIIWRKTKCLSNEPMWKKIQKLPICTATMILFLTRCNDKF